MRDNPLHVRVFGPDPQRRLRRLQRFFSGLLPYVQRKGLLLGAHEGENLIAVCGLLPPLLASNSPLGLFRLRHWLNAWARNDLREPHWHLGPMAVDPPWQGRRVGNRMLAACLAHTDTHRDASGAVAYLETDRSVNVAFYEGFGFQTVTQITVLGVPNWLMRRA
jgi:ribosomal protein S18 acetylase RimI-like enzyme